MRKAPEGVHRERVGDCRPAVWYVVWLGEPHREGSVILGRSRRLGRHMTHRFIPERGKTPPRVIKGWVEGAEWLLELHRGGG
jgi:hypothetical protein